MKPKNPTWITNSPAIAKKLRAADAAYAKAREAAKALPLAEKIIAYRKATNDLQAAYKKASYHAE